MSAQPARPCDCSVYNEIGGTGQIHDISEYPALNTNRCHLFRGTITITGTDQFWVGLRIRMEESSKIIVSTGLTIINCHISGCDDMWVGIETDYQSNLNAYNSIIEDAELGMNLGDHTGFHCEGTKFIDNFIGISIGSPLKEEVFDQVIEQRGDIVGCEFYTTTALPDPYPGMFYYPAWPTTPTEIPFNQGYAAIYVFGATGLVIGKTGAEGGERNLIHDMRNGIVMRYAVLPITGTNIYDLEGDQPRFMAHPVREINQTGIHCFLSFSNITDNVMEDMMVGISTNTSTNVIYDNDISILTTGIALTRTRGITAFSPQILKIEENVISEGYRGISVSPVTTTFEIKTNILDRNIIPKLNTGIDVRNSLLPDRREGIIKGNNIDITDGDGAFGIYLNNARYMDVDANNINYLEGEDVGYVVRGISAVATEHSFIHRNDIDADPDYLTNPGNYGMEFFFSGFNNAVCNTMNNFKADLYMLGANTETQLIGNTFEHGDYQLFLAAPVQMGVQNHNKNKWTEVPGTFGAYIDGPTDMTILNTAELSSFIYDPMCDDCLPDPIGPMIVEGNVWFQPGTDPAPYDPCPLSPDPIDLVDSLVRLIRTPLDFNDYNEEMEWSMKADLYEYMLLDPSLHSNTVLDSFYDVEEVNALGKLITWQHELNSRFGSIVQDKYDAQDTMTYLSEDLVDISAYLQTKPTDSVTWMTLRSLKADSLSETMGRWLTMLEDEEDDSYIAYDNIADDLDNLTTDYTIEEYLRQALIFKAQYQLGTTFSSGDSLDILALAELCPWLGGRAIAVAHDLYSIIADSTLVTTVDCPPPSPFQGGQNNRYAASSIHVTVMPNPTSDYILLESDKIMTEVTLTNVNRGIIDVQNPNAKTYTQSLSNLPEGVYFVVVKSNDKVDTKRIILIK